MGIKFYDKALINALTEKFSLSAEELESIKARKQNWWSEFTELYANRYNIEFNLADDKSKPTTRDIFNVESQILRELGDRESCVIAGRSGFYIFSDDPDAVKVFITCDKSRRVAKVMADSNLSEEEALKLVDKIDTSRETYTKTFSGTSRYDARNYDLVIDVSHISVDDAVNIIMEYIRRRR